MLQSCGRFKSLQPLSEYRGCSAPDNVSLRKRQFLSNDIALELQESSHITFSYILRKGIEKEKSIPNFNPYFLRKD
jgi:hypothetical protein